MDNPTKEQRSYRVVGMGCEGCADTVSNALEKVDGVDKALVNLDDETATVSLDSTRVTESELVESVQNAGYKLIVQ